MMSALTRNVPVAILLTAFPMLLGKADGFMLSSKSFGVSSIPAQRNPTSTTLFVETATSCASKYFQLEEMEDKDSCITEIYLASDHTVSLGETDGPEPLESSGTWEQNDAGDLKMVLKRKFESGRPETRATDVGEFAFSVERSYTGRVERVGALLGFAGSLHSLDEQRGDMDVGYFEMIDTTESKLENESER